MFLKKIDLLSSPISLFYKRLPLHSSFISGILTILCFVIVIIFSFCQIQSLFQRENETPISTSFTYYIEDAGTISFNPSSLFHFISLEDLNDRGNEEFNFSYFNAIGIEAPISDYASNTNIKDYNHWLYGYCNVESDIQGIEDIIKVNFITKSACIRKYYDSETKEYYETDNPKFRWPSISHGTFNPNNNVYSIIIRECDQTILNDAFNGELTCKDINTYNMYARLAHLYFIDQYIDILKYDNPITKYFYRIENLFEAINYSINNININPSLIKSNIGYIFNKEKEEFSYSYERNDPMSYQRTCEMYMGYSFFLNNRLNYHERVYLTIPEILSTIGGTLNIVNFIMSFINNFFNSYNVLTDFIYMLNAFYITEEDIKKVNNKNIINKKLSLVEEIQKQNCPFTKTSTRENIKKEELKEKDKETVANNSINTEKSENTDLPKVTSDTDNMNNTKEKEDENQKKNENKTVFSLFNYFLYTITFGKKDGNHLELYEDFRKRIISEENLMQNFLKLNGLLELEKRRSKIKNK